MRLHPEACEYYRLRITTEPAITPGAWELSLDGGTTWHTATVIDNDAAWLIKGPAYTGDSAAIPVTADVRRVLIRAIDSPETIIRSGTIPEIRLT